MHTFSIGKYRYPVKQRNPKDSNILKAEMSDEYKTWYQFYFQAFH